MELDSGTIAWMLTSTALVLLMTPGLALFYGGQARSKSVLNMMMMVFSTIATVGVLWVIFGYSMSFGDDVGGGLLGNPGQYFMLSSLLSETVQTDGLPDIAFVAFQAMFAILTVGLIAGAAADRMKFNSWMVFSLLWATIVYFPIAHWVFDLDAGLDRQRHRRGGLRRWYGRPHQRRYRGSRALHRAGQAPWLAA